MGGISETIELALTDEPVTIRSTASRTYSEQALRKAKELDTVGAPIGISQREAIKLLRENGYSAGKTVYLTEAIRLRTAREPFKTFGL